MIAGYAAGERGARAVAREGAAVVIVDAFRASTTIAVLVRTGARMIPVASIEEAAEYAGAYCRVGERGAKARGFDFGSSPTEVEAVDLPPGTTVVLSTTNGTRIIEAARGTFAILAGAFVNAHAVADKLASGAYGERVAVIGCGWEGRRASEDESSAGAILYRLRKSDVGLDRRARRAVDLYLARPEKSLSRNSAARRLARLGHKRGIDFCLTENTVLFVSFLEGDIFVGRWWRGVGRRA